MKIENKTLISIDTSDLKDGALTIPGGVTRIGKWAFDNCTGLTSIIIPDRVTHIGNRAFGGCTGLTSIIIPESVTQIGKWAFDGCSSLTSITIERLEGKGTYKVLVADECIAFINKCRDFNGETKIYECDLFLGMTSRELRLRKCVIAESNNVFSHGDDVKQALADLRFKLMKNRGSEQYSNRSIDSRVPFDEAVLMYRVITGACRFGTDLFISLQKEVKESYSPREIIAMTEGQYGATAFRNFFEGER